jgi:TolA-binding protein
MIHLLEHVSRSTIAAACLAIGFILAAVFEWTPMGFIAFSVLSTFVALSMRGMVLFVNALARGRADREAQITQELQERVDRLRQEVEREQQATQERIQNRIAQAQQRARTQTRTQVVPGARAQKKAPAKKKDATAVAKPKPKKAKKAKPTRISLIFDDGEDDQTPKE